MKTINEIILKYQYRKFNKNNIKLGGWNDENHCSERYLDASNDKGKLTLTEAVNMFYNALSNKEQKDWSLTACEYFIRKAYPNLEWHHREFFNYKSNLGREYFLNAEIITELATHWGYNNPRDIENLVKNLELEYLRDEDDIVIISKAEFSSLVYDILENPDNNYYNNINFYHDYEGNIWKFYYNDIYNKFQNKRQWGFQIEARTIMYDVTYSTK